MLAIGEILLQYLEAATGAMALNRDALHLHAGNLAGAGPHPEVHGRRALVADRRGDDGVVQLVVGDLGGVDELAGLEVAAAVAPYDVWNVVPAVARALGDVSREHHHGAVREPARRERVQ